MSTTYNIYCDESCHLENDHKDVMVLGAISCPLEATRNIAEEIRQIKAYHGLPKAFEVKWTKVSPAKAQFYLDIVNYFFNNDDLCFRALVVRNKSKLRHKDFGQTHDEWYYKMYFTLLKVILDPLCRYRIYLDIKDTQSVEKVNKLHDVLCSNISDFKRSIIQRIQPVHSHEVEQIQLADLLTGTIGYVNRNQIKSVAKSQLVEQVKKISGHSLTQKTLLKEKKCNLFFLQLQEDNQ